MLGDPHQTLPYMLGDDQDDQQASFISGHDSQSELDFHDTSIPRDAHLTDPDLEVTMGLGNSERPRLPHTQTTRAGRRTKLPARYQD